MGRKVDKSCTHCKRRTKKRRHNHCPGCGGKLTSVSAPDNPAKISKVKEGDK